jgi:hypothetical protein
LNYSKDWSKYDSIATTELQKQLLTNTYQIP